MEGRGGKRVQKRNGLTPKTMNSSMKVSGSDVSSRHIASKAIESQCPSAIVGSAAILLLRLGRCK